MTRSKTKRPKLSSRKILILGLIVVVVLATGGAYSYLVFNDGSDEGVGPNQSMSSSADTSFPPLDKAKYSTDDPASPWVVVNKGRQLPSSYRPTDLVVPPVSLRYTSGTEMQMRAEAADALTAMFKSAGTEGIKLMVASGFRSYSLQSAVYNRHVKDYGVVEADKVSARPGHSEHQTGWAVDVAPTSRKCVIESCFGELAEGRWVADHAPKYGFVIRYPAGGQQLTGYSYEPWHIRYVGTELAQELASNGQTLEQFFGLPAFTTYPSSIQRLK